jgi:potassium-transporting ATPase KdpC subunit
MRDILRELRIALVATVALMTILCFLYPVTIWCIARIFYPEEADGSLVHEGRNVIGSARIGQPFRGAGYFHGRPSAAGDGYDAANSGGSNLGPISKKLLDSVAERVRSYRAENGLPEGVRVPVDAVTASGSGLDPDIGIENAFLQAPRVAAARGLATEDVIGIVRRRAEGRTFGIFGQPRVNVLLLNLDLDRKATSR